MQKGRSTKKFLEICNKNNGWLFSVDQIDCSKVSYDKRWKFFQTRDDNFEYIKSNIPKKIDVLFIDTLHEAKHVKKLFYEYYPLIKKNGFIFIDDISHLPYLKKKKKCFYCEINNKETFETLLSIYSENENNFNIDFHFLFGFPLIKKLNENILNPAHDLKLRHKTIKNIIKFYGEKSQKINIFMPSMEGGGVEKNLVIIELFH